MTHSTLCGGGGEGMGSGHSEMPRKGEAALEKNLLSGGRVGWYRLCPSDLTSLEEQLKDTLSNLFLDFSQEQELQTIDI